MRLVIHKMKERRFLHISKLHLAHSCQNSPRRELSAHAPARKQEAGRAAFLRYNSASSPNRPCSRRTARHRSNRTAMPGQSERRKERAVPTRERATPRLLPRAPPPRIHTPRRLRKRYANPKGLRCASPTRRGSSICGLPCFSNTKMHRCDPSLKENSAVSTNAMPTVF